MNFENILRNPLLLVEGAPSQLNKHQAIISLTLIETVSASGNVS